MYYGLILLLALKLGWSWCAIVDFNCSSLLELLTLLAVYKPLVLLTRVLKFQFTPGFQSLCLDSTFWDSLVNVLE